MGWLERFDERNQQRVEADNVDYANEEFQRQIDGGQTQSLFAKTMAKRPRLVLVGVVLVGFRFGREFLYDVLVGKFGPIGWVVGPALLFVLAMAWRYFVRRKAAGGDGEFTEDMVAAQIADAGLPGPAFTEDGTLRGASVFVVNQRSKLLEVVTEYALFDSAGKPLGAVRQIAQGKVRRFFRVFTPFDQFFTHHFEVYDTAGSIVLRMTRPRKFFRSRIHVFEADDRFVGMIRQENVFWKIRFRLCDAQGSLVGSMRAENLRAWDFPIRDRSGREVARVTKSWEGFARLVLTQADRYVVRVHEPLPEPLRTLTLATALSIDLALKQDPQGLNG